jgi:hypothetical protein
MLHARRPRPINAQYACCTPAWSAPSAFRRAVTCPMVRLTKPSTLPTSRLPRPGIPGFDSTRRSVCPRTGPSPRPRRSFRFRASWSCPWLDCLVPCRGSAVTPSCYACGFPCPPARLPLRFDWRTSEKDVVLRVRSNPKPQGVPARLDRQCPVMQPDPNRWESVYLLEMQRRVRPVRLQ